MTTLNDFINTTAEAWAAEFIQQRIAALERRKAVATGNLTRDMRYELTRQAVNEASRIVMIFEGYGRILDMRRINPHTPGEEMINNLIEYVKAKGVQNFKRTRSKRFQPKTETKLIRDIAWGIARKRAKGKQRRKVWWAKSKSAAITDLFNQIAAGMLDITADEVVKELKFG